MSAIEVGQYSTGCTYVKGTVIIEYVHLIRNVINNEDWQNKKMSESKKVNK